MEHFLPHDTLAYIGRSLTFSGMSEALAKDVFPKNFQFQIERMAPEGTSITLPLIEDRSRPMREALGLKHGHLLLAHFVDQVYAPLKKWVELDRLNKGGRPPQIARRIFIRELARAAPNIVGRKATIATTGRFVNLCSAVLLACGLPAEGVEKAIPGIVKQVRSEKPKRAKVKRSSK